MNEEEKNKDCNHMTELDIFQLFFSDEIIKLLVQESNNYYQKILFEKYGSDYKNLILSQESKNSNNKYLFYFVTRGISKEDILAFIGIRIYMGLHKYPNISSYWSNNIFYY